MKTIIFTAIFISTLFTGLNFLIVAAGVIVTLEAIEADVSYSNDHPLVKKQGLPI